MLETPVAIQMCVLKPHMTYVILNKRLTDGKICPCSSLHLYFLDHIYAIFSFNFNPEFVLDLVACVDVHGKFLKQNVKGKVGQ